MNGLHHQIADIYGLEILSLRQILNSFGRNYIISKSWSHCNVQSMV